MDVLGEVLETKDYDLFNTEESFVGNRSPKIRPFLMEEIKKFTQVSPIIVNEDMVIIDGQHRFLACKELKVAVKFIQIKGLSIKHTKSVNNSKAVKSWTTNDYLNSYDNLGNNNYTMFKVLKNSYKLSISSLCALVYGMESSNPKISFNTGGLDFDVKKNSKWQGRLPIFMDIFSTNEGKFSRQLKKSRLLKVMGVLISDTKYNHEHFIKRLDSLDHVNSLGNDVDVKVFLNNVYNKGLSQVNRILL